MNITIGSIIKDRSWCIGRFLSSLYKSYLYYHSNTKDPKDLQFLILDDNSKDSTFKDIWQYLYIDLNKTKDLIRYNHPILDTVIELKDKKNASARGYSFERLAYLRNKLLRMTFATGKAAYLFTVDSDIIVSEDCLFRLIEANKDIVAAPVRNSPNENVLNFLYRSGDSFTRNIDSVRSGIPEYPRILPKLFRVDLTGACALISKAAHDRLPPQPYSADDAIGKAEDVGFAESCYTHGVEQWVRSDITTTHLYNQNTELVPIHREENVE